MGKVISVKAVAQGGLVGDVALYFDASCTQPVSEITQVDLGIFPFAPTEGTDRESSKSVNVWCKNEANYPMRLWASSDNPLVSPHVSGGIGSILGLTGVLALVVKALYNGAGNGSDILFKITIGGDPIGI